MKKSYNTIIEELIDYSNEIIKGKIIACKRHKQACERFLRDLHRMEHDDGFPYYWDEVEAQKVVKFFGFLRHKEGALAGKPIELNSFQRFLVCNIEAWKHIDTNYRRFKFVYIQLARKNAKSQLQGGLCLYEIFGKKIMGAQIYTLGVEREQAKEVYNACKDMLSKPLKKRLKISIPQIYHSQSNSIIKHLSKKAGKTGDGKNPQFASIDEYHAHETSEMYNVMSSGMVSRPEPLIVIITTAGEDFENKPCYAEYKDCCSILDGTLTNEKYFILICEVEKNDDVEDMEAWKKANPVLMTYDEGNTGIEEAFQKKYFSSDPTQKREFLTKNLNIWVGASDKKYLDVEEWNACKQEYDYEKFRGCDCLVGIDLSKSGDLTSVAFEFPFLEEGIRKYALISHSFLPAGVLRDHMKTDNGNYDIWKEKGYLTTTEANEGLIVDYWALLNYIQDMKEKYDLNIIQIGYDPNGALMLVTELESIGFNCIEIKQSARSLNESTVNFRDLVKVKQIYHNGNKLLTWSVGNAEFDSNSFGEIKISKKSRFKRIDPIASSIFAHKLAMEYWNNKPLDLKKQMEPEYLKKLGW